MCITSPEPSRPNHRVPRTRNPTCPANPTNPIYAGAIDFVLTCCPHPATRTCKDDGPNESVTTCGHRLQAFEPSWRHHRQFLRSAQCGSWSTTSGSNSTTRATNRQLPLSKCRQAPRAHGAADRNTSVGSAGLARASMSSEAGSASARYSTRGSSTVPVATPNTTLPGSFRCALGQSCLAHICFKT